MQGNLRCPISGAQCLRQAAAAVRSTIEHLFLNISRIRDLAPELIVKS